MKKILLLLMLGATFLMAAETKLCPCPDEKPVREMEPKELYKLITDEVDDLWILDIREPDQIGHGEIFTLNLVQITRGYLEFKIRKAIPDLNARVVIYCCTGKRGRLAAKTMQEMGYTNVYSLKGGIREWVEQGYPLDTVYGEVVLKR
ncbi:rhodanese-like domain-containing protein [Hydrogenimonas sp.]